MALATVDDVAVPLLRELSAAERVYAARLLGWAEILIRGRFADFTALNQDAVVMVESQAVARVLRNPDGKYQESLSGEYASTRDRIGADGVLRITDEEWSLLAPSSAASSGGAFAIDTVSAGLIVHSIICSLNFGANYCSCGASLTMGWPLYEVVE